MSLAWLKLCALESNIFSALSNPVVQLIATDLSFGVHVTHIQYSEVVRMMKWPKKAIGDLLFMTCLLHMQQDFSHCVVKIGW